MVKFEGGRNKTKMTKAKPEHYQAGYNRLYGFLRTRHPDILEEYREYLREVKRKVEEALLVAEEETEK